MGYSSGNTSPTDHSDVPDHAPAHGTVARMGQVEPVTWTFAQTVRGAIATLAPWLVFIWVIALLSAQSTATTQRHLSTVEDIVGGIVSFALTGGVELAFVVAPAYFVVVRRAPGITRREAFVALGFRRMPLRPAIAVTIVGFVAIISINLLYGYLVQLFHLQLHTNSDELLQQARYAPITSLALVAGAVLIAPICEEIFFRGYLFGGLLQRMGLWPAALLSAALFALAHGDIGSLVVLFVFGLVLAYVRWRCGSLWPGIIIHMANNATAAVVIVLALTAR